MKTKTILMQHFDKMEKIYQRNGSVIGSVEPSPTQSEIDYAENLGFKHELLLSPCESEYDYVDVFSKCND